MEKSSRGGLRSPRHPAGRAVGQGERGIGGKSAPGPVRKPGPAPRGALVGGEARPGRTCAPEGPVRGRRTESRRDRVSWARPSGSLLVHQHRLRGRPHAHRPRGGKPKTRAWSGGRARVALLAAGWDPEGQRTVHPCPPISLRKPLGVRACPEGSVHRPGSTRCAMFVGPLRPPRLMVRGLWPGCLTVAESSSLTSY